MPEMEGILKAVAVALVGMVLVTVPQIKATAAGPFLIILAAIVFGIECIPRD